MGLASLQWFFFSSLILPLCCVNDIVFGFLPPSDVGADTAFFFQSGLELSFREYSGKLRCNNTLAVRRLNSADEVLYTPGVIALVGSSNEALNGTGFPIISPLVRRTRRFWEDNIINMRASRIDETLSMFGFLRSTLETELIYVVLQASFIESSVALLLEEAASNTGLQLLGITVWNQSAINQSTLIGEFIVRAQPFIPEAIIVIGNNPLVVALIQEAQRDPRLQNLTFGVVSDGDDKLIAAALVNLVGTNRIYVSQVVPFASNSTLFSRFAAAAAANALSTPTVLNSMSFEGYITGLMIASWLQKLHCAEELSPEKLLELVYDPVLLLILNFRLQIDS